MADAIPHEHASTRESGRGRHAQKPHHIPLRGWKDILWRSWQELKENNIFLVTGGVTYAVLLALFPGLAALVSLYGLVFDPSQVEQQVSALSGVLPEQGQQVLSSQLHSLASTSTRALGFSAIFSLLVALWSASRGMSGMITALDIAYGQKDERSFIRFNLVAIALTLGLLVGGISAIALVAILPAVIGYLDLGAAATWALLILEWPLLAGLVMLGLAVLYRYGPDRDEAQWQWVSAGAIAATVLWIISSIAFSIYVSNFASYDKTYGSLGGAIVLLTWLYLSVFVTLLGAVINTQAERQTSSDTTEGQPRPMGRRDAFAADTLGESSEKR
ncbi:MAG: YihY/virulence factor BrkB family protein [Gammaproteobacteria bacterium]